MKTHPLLINGKDVAALSGKTYSAVNPATSEEIAAIASAGTEDVTLAVQAARRAFDEGPWPRMTARQRGEAAEDDAVADFVLRAADDDDGTFGHGLVWAPGACRGTG